MYQYLENRVFFNNYYENMYYNFQTELNNVLKNKQFIFKDRIWP